MTFLDFALTPDPDVILTSSIPVLYNNTIISIPVLYNNTCNLNLQIMAGRNERGLWRCQKRTLSSSIRQQVVGTSIQMPRT